MNYQIKKLSPFRLLSIYGYEAIGQGHNMFALLELDVTDIRQKLRSHRKDGNKVSFFSYLLSSIANTIDENIELNSIRCGRKVYYFDEVDIDTAIEFKLDGILVPRKCLIRNAAKKTMAEITLEIEDAKRNWKQADTSGEDDKWAQSWLKFASLLAKFIFKLLITQFSKRPLNLKKGFGTTYVTSVGGFSDANGFVIPYIPGQTRPVAFVIGNIVKKTCVIGSEIKIRDFLSMTITINHDLVDGAPAARFVNRLKQRVEGNYHNNA
jgi:pyruvate/2-oxoglutarate dehydrogenase complex dihydrolipoamide acyltransferase (E2) component